jgi:hypothetical protein
MKSCSTCSYSVPGVGGGVGNDVDDEGVWVAMPCHVLFKKLLKTQSLLQKPILFQSTQN